jgi:hypothetical protein
MMADGFLYDVFLSHNKADKPRVRDPGLRVWFGDRAVRLGDDIYRAGGWSQAAWHVTIGRG